MSFIRKFCKERFHGINAEHEIRTEKCLEHDENYSDFHQKQSVIS